MPILRQGVVSSMANHCEQYVERIGLLPSHPDFHSCGTCKWIDPESPTRCTPPNFGVCTTEDKGCSRVNCDGCEHRPKRCLARDHWVCLIANRTVPLEPTSP